jgi:hypothetical protein
MIVDFAMAFATHLSFNGVHRIPHFDQFMLRPQLIYYLEQKEINFYN